MMGFGFFKLIAAGRNSFTECSINCFTLTIRTDQLRNIYLIRTTITTLNDHINLTKIRHRFPILSIAANFNFVVVIFADF